jgi:3-deoxy-D-manno-octulosonic acid kinase
MHPSDTYTTITPPQYPARTCVVAVADREAIAAALGDAMASPGTSPGGRGGIVRQGKIIARRCRRGGLIRHWVSDGYLRNRPRAEFEVHGAAVAASLPVPPLLGVCWEKRGLFYHGALATGALDAVELLDALRETPERAETLLAATGAVTARMHDAGFSHADLQVRNVLVDPACAVYLIDWDRARAVKRLSSRQRAMNMYRFRRSLEKHGFPTAYFRYFCAGYGAAPGLPLLGWWYALRSRVSGRASR